MPPTRAAQPVMDLLHRQDELFGRLEGLAARQKDLITSEDMEPLVGLLACRQRLCTELSLVTRELAPIRRDWTAERLRLEIPQRREADELMSRAGDRIRRLMDCDEEDARKLSIRKQAVGQTLRAAGGAQQALNAYRAGAERTSRLDCMDASQ
jgi:hypothetical protein